MAQSLAPRFLSLAPTAIAILAFVACAGKSSTDSGGSAGSAGSAGAAGNGGTAGTGGTLGDAGDMPVTRAPGECDNPTPVVVDGVDTGLVRCDGPFLQRSTAGVCPSRVPRVGVQEGDANTECREDTDCVARPHGWCGRPPGDFQASVACQYGCERDADCNPGELCACDDSVPAGVCVPATCATNDDCPPPALCTARQTSACGGNPERATTKEFACQRDEDDCTANDECSQASYTLCVRGACMPGAGACGGG